MIGDPRLARVEFASAQARWQNQDRLDPIIERWTLGQTPHEATETSQRAGVAAARIQNGESLSRDLHLLEQGAFEQVDHPVLGEARVVGPPWRMQGAKIPCPAPLLGQHNDYVLGEILDLENHEIKKLIEEEVVY